MPSDLQRYAQKLSCMLIFADSLAKLSTDGTFHIGCVVFPLDCTEVYAIGYNGAPSGLEHTRLSKKMQEGASGMCHAELNALSKLRVPKDEPCLMFVHTMPCLRCAGQIANKLNIVGLIHEDAALGYDDAGLRRVQEASVQTVHRDLVQAAALGEEIEVLRKWREAAHARGMAARNLFRQ